MRRLGRFRPDFLGAHARDPARYPFLLESALHAGAQGRFDLLMAASAERLVLDGAGELRGRTGGAHGFLPALDAWFAAERAVSAPDPSLPFAGGWFLYLGYELAAEVEPRVVLPRADGPVAVAVRVRAAAVHDHATGTVTLVAEPEASAELDALERALRPAAADPAPAALALEVEEDDPARYLDAVRRALDYIRRGDIYQANLARGWRARLPAGLGPADVYARLRHANPGPFAGLAVLGGVAVLSTSPERLVAARPGVVETRPIAGTRPRTGDDAAMRAELRTNAKERAEHVMLVDLCRNDLGRISEGGSVVVDEFMSIESYAHVHHIVSNVRGRPRPGVTPGETIRAVFPGGTITGCPKVRCLEIIAELEGAPRGPYTGSFGYLGVDGRLDLNILIRTVAFRPDPGAGAVLSLHAGAGVVADSDPALELAETRAKAQGLLRALAADPR
jgi:anthranilate synthase component 1